MAFGLLSSHPRRLPRMKAEISVDVVLSVTNIRAVSYCRLKAAK
jgi:hypothetical protein